ncbi:alpha/beta fold hydrolase [Tenacibaculum soleae]|uniref:alpha/beta fold hydrolase n=1 Tax=Tenacibaculum soleae TaxID=447689 RepID=UPI0026E1E555|nr:alpha/beta hydrolase [Tenacibaculum soleae]MDO6811629.1 alpha/beta hydrolase [Tenacibaculum soleae]
MQKVYFISGTMCTVDLWQFVFPRLENIFPVHIDITLATSFDEINKIILSKIDEKAIIVGFSLGGFSALNFATHYPEKVKKLVIIAANTNGLNDNEVQLRKSTIDFLQNKKYKGISLVRIQQFLHPNHQNKEIISIIKKMDATLGKEVLIRQLKATSSRLNITEQVLSLNIPIILIAAENDALISIADVKILVSKLQNGKHIIIKNCGHMIPLEKPEELANLLNWI